MSPPIHVAAGVVVRDGRLLLTQRDPGRSDYGHLWECPGGKVEPLDMSLVPPGDGYRAALARELREELRVTATVAEWLADADVRRGDGSPAVVHFFVARLSADQRPVPVDAIGLGWFSWHEVASLAMAPANVQVRSLLLSRLPFAESALRVGRAPR